MALILKTVPAARGTRWIVEAWHLFLRRPLAFMGMSALFALLSTLVQLVPPLSLLVVMTPPLLSLGFMVAGQSALLDGPVNLRQFIEPLRGDSIIRRRLLKLCLLYGVSILLIALLAFGASGASLSDVQSVGAAGESVTAPPVVDVLQPSVQGTLALVLTLVGLLSVPFWHAPALVYWGGQGLAQALFSSAMAVWRCRGAFLVYALGMAGLFVGAMFCVILVASLVGAPAVAMLVGVPVALSLTAVFYLSVLFTFNDSFGNAAPAAAPAVEPPATP